MPYYCSMFVIAEAPLSLEGSPSFVDGSAPDLFYSREFRFVLLEYRRSSTNITK